MNLERWALHPEALEHVERFERLREALTNLGITQSPEEKSGRFIEVMMAFEDCLVTDADSKVVRYYTPKIFEEILSYTSLIVESIASLAQSLQTLIMSQNLVFELPEPKSVNQIFISCCIYAETRLHMLDLGSTFFLPLFARDAWVVKALSSELPRLFFSQIVTKCNNPNIVEWGLKMLLEQMNDSALGLINPTAILEACVNLPRENMDVSICNIIAERISTFFMKHSKKNRQTGQIFANLKAFDVIWSFCEDNKTREKIFLDLLGSGYDNTKINEHVARFLANLYSENGDEATVLFEIAQKYKEYKLLDKYIPIYTWFNEYRPVEILIDFFVVIDEECPDMVLGVMPHLFKTMSVSNSLDDVEYFQQVLNICHSQVISQNVTHEQLASCGFFPGLILKQSVESRTSLLLSNDWLEEFILDVVRNDNDEKRLVFRALLEVADVFPSPATRFLLSWPSRAHIKEMIDFLERQTKEQFFTVLEECLRRNDRISEKFLSCRGMFFLNQCLSNGNICIDLFISLIDAVVSIRPHDKVDLFIRKLPKTHPIFHLPIERYRNLVFGTQTGKYRQIRIASLFHFLDERELTDPYNSYVLGRFSVKQFLNEGRDIRSIPQLNVIANRYINSKHVDMLLEYPNMLNEFSDVKNFDHFPIFQFYPGEKELKFVISFKCVSFWCKFDVADDNPAVFFNSNSISMTLVKDILSIKIGNKVFETQWETGKWNHVMVQAESSFLSSSVSVIVNGECICKGTASEKELFNYASFVNSGNHLMFLGSAIRFFREISDVQVKAILSKSPGFIDSGNEFASLTPFNIRQTSTYYRVEVPVTCCSVPYCGFPMHFVSPKRISDLFAILNHSASQEQFQSLFYAILNINTVVNKRSERFWSRVLSSMKKCKKYVVKDMFLAALFSVHNNDDKSIHNLTSVLFDQKMWESVDNEMLISVVFENFKDIQWNLVPDFEVFLGIVVLNNPKSEVIVDTLLRNGLTRSRRRLVNICHDLVSIMSDPSENEIRYTIARCMAKYAENDALGIASAIDYQSLRSLMFSSVPDFAAQLYHLAVQITISQPSYCTMDKALLAAVLRLVEHKSVWSDTMRLVELNIVYIPLLVGLVWARCTYIVNCLANNGEIENDLEDDLQRSLDFCSAKIVDVLSSKLSMAIVATLFPITLGLPVFMDQCENLYLQDLICRIVFKCYDKDAFHRISFAFQTVPVTRYITSSGFYDFAAKLLVRAPVAVAKNLFPSMLLCLPYYEVSLAGSFVWSIISCIVKQDLSVFPGHQMFMSYVMYFMVNKVLTNDEIKSILEILLTKVPLVWRKTQVFTCIVVHAIETLGIDQLSQLLMDNMSTIVSSFAGNKADGILFYLMANNETLKSELVSNAKWSSRQLEQMRTNAENDVLKHASENLLQQAVNIGTNISKELSLYKPSTELDDLSSFVMPEIDEKMKARIDAFRYKQSIMQSAMNINVEKIKWTNFITKIRDPMIRVTKFQPKSYYMTSKYWPYNPPKLLVPSMYPHKSPEIQKKFEKHSTRMESQANSAMLRRLFMKTFGGSRMCHYLPATIIRYVCGIKCVMFIYPEEIMFLTFACLTGEDSITLIECKNKAFIEEVITGQWGTTSMFFGHVVIRIPVNHIIHISQNYGLVAFWTFGHGHFLVKTDRRSLMQVKFKITNLDVAAIDRLSDEPLLVKVTDVAKAYQKWSAGDISTDEMLLVVNGLCGRSFAYLQVYPCFPSKLFTINIKPFPTRRETATMLYRIAPFSCYSIKPSRSGDDDESSEISYSCDQHSESSEHIRALIEANHTGNMPNPMDSILRNRMNSCMVEDHSQMDSYKRVRRFSDTPSAFSQKAILQMRKVIAHGMLGDMEDTLTDSQCRMFMEEFADVDEHMEAVYEDELDKVDAPALIYYVPELFNGTEITHVTGISPLEVVNKRRRLLSEDGRAGEIASWISCHFHVDRPTKFPSDSHETVVKPVHIGDMNHVHVCQEIRKPCPNLAIFVEIDKTVKRMKRLIVQVTDSHVVVIDKQSLCISIMTVPEKKSVWTAMDHFLFFAKSISISQNAMFIVVDFGIGLTRCYQIVYSEKQPRSLSLTAEFSWRTSPASAVSGIHWLIATSVRNILVLWDMFSGTIHRTVTFDAKLKAISFDERYGVWVAAENEALFVSVNGEILARRRISEPITKITAIQLHDNITDRYCICGTAKGSIFIAMTRFDTKTIEFKQLPSEHSCEIDNIVISKSLKSFISVDGNKTVFHWTAVNTGCTPLDPQCYRCCAQCRENSPVSSCRCCGLGFCKNCLPKSSHCSLCTAIDNVFL